jgi:hypothetical protein
MLLFYILNKNDINKYAAINVLEHITLLDGLRKNKRTRKKKKNMEMTQEMEVDEV